MKVAKHNPDNYPDRKTVTITDPVVDQALKDKEKHVNDVDIANDEISKGLKDNKVDGAPKQPHPDEAEVPEAIKESLNEELFIESDPEEEPTWENIESTLTSLVCPAGEVFGFIIKDKMDPENWQIFKAVKDKFNSEEEAKNMLMDKFHSDSMTMDENVNEENAGRVVQNIIKEKWGIDADIQVYKDEENSHSVIVEFTVSQEDCDKIEYDELKDEIKKRIKGIRLSCKQFSSPNLNYNGRKYRLKLIVIQDENDAQDETERKLADARERKNILNKRQNKQVESDTDNEQNDKKEGENESMKILKEAKVQLSPWTKVYIELSKQQNFSSAQSNAREIKELNGNRYWDDPMDQDKQDISIDGNRIIVYGPNAEYLDFAQKVADHYDRKEAQVEENKGKGSSDPNKKYRIVFEFTDDELPTDEEEEMTDTKYTIGFNKENGEPETWPHYSDEKWNNDKFDADGNLIVDKLKKHKNDQDSTKAEDFESWWKKNFEG